MLLEVRELDGRARRKPPPALVESRLVELDLRDELHWGQTAAAVARHHASIPRSDAIAPAAL